VSKHRELASQKRAEAQIVRDLARAMSVLRDRDNLLKQADALDRQAAELDLKADSIEAIGTAAG
jgi:hypothetical protein